jgi:hypothetical protein
LKILFIFLRALTRVIKLAGCAGVLGVLSGCWVPGMEPEAYPYGLRIENRLAATIEYCYGPSRDTGCYNVADGNSKDIGYMSYWRGLTDKEMRNIFYTLNIVICDKMVDLKRIQSVSPIIKRENYYFEIIIDKTVVDAFCKQGS